VSHNEQDEERKTFLDEMSGVTPLQSKTTKPWKQRLPPRPLPTTPETDEDEFVDVQITTHDFLEYRRDGIQHRLFQDLQRGVIKPEKTLDLHGLRVVEARRELAQFIPWCAKRRVPLRKNHSRQGTALRRATADPQAENQSMAAAA